MFFLKKLKKYLGKKFQPLSLQSQSNKKGVYPSVGGWFRAFRFRSEEVGGSKRRRIKREFIRRLADGSEHSDLDRKRSEVQKEEE